MGSEAQSKVADALRALLPDEPCHYDYRPEWLRTGKAARAVLELDIYYPRLRLAVEYQGVQHFRAVQRYGFTSDDLVMLKARDAKKSDLCRSNHVYLFTVSYGDLLDALHLTTLLASFIATARAGMVARQTAHARTKRRKRHGVSSPYGKAARDLGDYTEMDLTYLAQHAKTAHLREQAASALASRRRTTPSTRRPTGEAGTDDRASRPALG